MHKLSLFYLRWIAFWRVPESTHIRRVNSPLHQRKVRLVRRGWGAGIVVLLLTANPVIWCVGGLLMTFLSFMVLDEVPFN